MPLDGRPILLGFWLLAGWLLVAPQSHVVARTMPEGETGSLAESARRALLADGSLEEPAEELPLPPAGGFPDLPPDPDAESLPLLPALEEELLLHGGSHLYVPEGDEFHLHGDHFEPEPLRLPEYWVAPQPWTWFNHFLGAEPIFTGPRLEWGPCGYMWDLRLVAFGGYSLFAFALEQNHQRHDALGHQLLVDLDLRLTGTERFHVQFRPLGRGSTGGSFYQFSDPSGYVDNSTGAPQRYWFEAELRSLFGNYLDPFMTLDHNLVVGKFPLALQNALLMNTEILGVAAAKNNLYAGNLSNLNVQFFAAAHDVEFEAPVEGTLYGVNVTADHRGDFFEGNYVFLDHAHGPARDTHYFAAGGTRFYGPLSLAARALIKWGDQAATGSGQLFVVESNYGRAFSGTPLGIEEAVAYGNAFLATQGWRPIAGGSFNRLRTAFETNPLVRLAAGIEPGDTWGVALGVQLFRHRQDETWIPEIAFQSSQDKPAWGLGLRYLRKTGSRAFFEALLNVNLSNDPRFDREGLFASYNILF